MSSEDRIIFDNSTTDESITYSSKLTTTITSVSDDCWPTSEDSFDSNLLTTNQTKDMTDIEINTNINNTSIVSNECSIGEKSIQRLGTDESTEIINDLQLQNESNDQLNGEKSKSVLTQSQNLLVSKSRITYGIRKATDDKFDQIISRANNNPKVTESDDKLTESKDENGVKPIVEQSISDNAKKKSKVKRNISYDCKYISDDTDEDEYLDTKPQNIELNNRKPLAQLKRLQNNDTKVVNKKFKRVQRFDSSDEDIDSPVVIERKRKVQRIRESELVENDLNESSKEIEIPESDMSEEELPSIYSKKNESIEVSIR
jgi:hypothetical protein